MAKRKQTYNELMLKKDSSLKLTKKEGNRLRALKGARTRKKKNIEKKRIRKEALRKRKAKKEKKKQEYKTRQITRKANKFDITFQEAKEQISTKEKNELLEENIKNNPGADYLKDIQKRPTII